MPGYFLREFDCSICGQPFTMMEGDMILPIPRLCDSCLKENWNANPGTLQSDISMHIDKLKERWPSLESLITARVRDRQ